MSNENGTNNVGEDDLKRKLIRRVAFAGALIAMLLGVLAFIDYLGRPADEPIDAGPTFTAPVPVEKKEVTQPVKPVESEPAAADMPAAATETSLPPPSAEVPMRPEVDARPALPAPRGHAESRPNSSAAPRGVRSDAMAIPAEGTAAATVPSPPVPVPPAASTRQPVVSPPAAATPSPPRLFSGYAVQAGVFSDAQHAEELRAKLMLNGIPSTLEARVQIGPFKTRAEAEAAREKLKAIGVDGILLPPKGAKR